MNREKQREDTEKAVISPLAKDQTYGERIYHRIFDVGINFWLNLLASGAFTFWVTHYQKPIWGPGTFLGKIGVGTKFGTKMVEEGIHNLGQLHESKVQKMAEGNFLKKEFFKLDTHDLRANRAASIVNVFTLQLPGHFIVIPSLTIGARYKAAIVRHFNRKHYGEEAMHDADLIARHHAIEAEERPTFLGALMGRIGGMAINMSLGSVIGSENNLLNKLGDKTPLKSLKRFKGIDPVAGDIGEEIGGIARNVAPTFINKANNYFSTQGYAWSPAQQRAVLKGTSKFTATDIAGPYTHGVKDLSRFLAQDVMYTISTSSSIRPVVRGLRKILPGMTYTPKIAYDPEYENLPKLRVPRNPLAQEVEPIDTRRIADTSPLSSLAVGTDGRLVDTAAANTEMNTRSTTPRPHVTHVRTEATLAPRHEPAIVQG